MGKLFYVFMVTINCIVMTFDIVLWTKDSLEIDCEELQVFESIKHNICILGSISKQSL